MEIHYMRAFKSVALTENISQSARELYISQPALSKTIRRIEEELGVSLFDRVGKSIRLNYYGRIFQKHVDSILSELDAIDKQFAEIKGESSKVVLSITVATVLLPEILSDFLERYPDIKLFLVRPSLNSATPDCDVSIFASRVPLPSEDGLILLMQESVMVGLPKQHPMAGKPSVFLSELAEEPFVGFSKSHMNFEFCRMAGFEPNIVLESADPQIARSLLSVGMGVALIPPKTWKHIPQEEMMLLPIEEPKCERYIYLRYNTGGYISENVSCFIRYIQNFFAELDK